MKLLWVSFHIAIDFLTLLRHFASPMCSKKSFDACAGATSSFQGQESKPERLRDPSFSWLKKPKHS